MVYKNNSSIVKNQPKTTYSLISALQPTLYLLSNLLAYLNSNPVSTVEGNYTTFLRLLNFLLPTIWVVHYGLTGTVEEELGAAGGVQGVPSVLLPESAEAGVRAVE